MLIIPCPYCGERDESEFTYGGEAHRHPPKNPTSVTEEEWVEYLFYRTNVKGEYHELWYHSSGCRKWFNVIRNTISYKISESYMINAEPKENKNNYE